MAPQYSTIKADVRLNLTLAKLATERQAVKYAPDALASAAYVAATCKTMLALASHINLASTDRAYYEEAQDQANRLIDSFWSDYKLVPTQVAQSLPPAAVSENGNGKRAEEKHERKPRVFLDENQKAELVEMFNNRPADKSKEKWKIEVGQAWNVHPSTVDNIVNAFKQG